MTDRDWMRLIDKRAALSEQFPRLQKLMHERPGCQVDRDRQEHYRVENRASMERTRAAADADADRFIAEMERRKRETFLAALAARRQERKSA